MLTPRKCRETLHRHHTRNGRCNQHGLQRKRDCAGSVEPTEYVECGGGSPFGSAEAAGAGREDGGVEGGGQEVSDQVKWQFGLIEINNI